MKLGQGPNSNDILSSHTRRGLFSRIGRLVKRGGNHHSSNNKSNHNHNPYMLPVDEYVHFDETMATKSLSAIDCRTTASSVRTPATIASSAVLSAHPYNTTTMHNRRRFSSSSLADLVREKKLHPNPTLNNTSTSTLTTTSTTDISEDKTPLLSSSSSSFSSSIPSTPPLGLVPLVSITTLPTPPPFAPLKSALKTTTTSSSLNQQHQNPPQLKSALKKHSSYTTNSNLQQQQQQQQTRRKSLVEQQQEQQQTPPQTRRKSLVEIDFDDSVSIARGFQQQQQQQHGSRHRRNSFGGSVSNPTTSRAHNNLQLAPSIEFDSRSGVFSSAASVTSFSKQSSSQRSVVSTKSAATIASTRTSASAPPNLWDVDKAKNNKHGSSTTGRVRRRHFTDDRTVASESCLLVSKQKQPEDIAEELHDTVLTSMLVQGNPMLAESFGGEGEQTQEEWMQFLDLSKGAPHDVSASMRRIALRRQLGALHKVLNEQPRRFVSSSSSSSIVPPSPPLHKSRDETAIGAARSTTTPDQPQQQLRLSNQTKLDLKDLLRSEAKQRSGRRKKSKKTVSSNTNN